MLQFQMRTNEDKRHTCSFSLLIELRYGSARRIRRQEMGSRDFVLPGLPPDSILMADAPFLLHLTAAGCLLTIDCDVIDPGGLIFQVAASLM